MSDAGEESQAAAVKQVTFNVKASSDAKYVVTVPENITVLDLKSKLSTSEYADVAAERQRLIYSGRVLKNEDALSTYNIKDGNTIHMVKGAASNQRQNPASSSGAPTASSNPASNVPSNIATGAGTDPLAGLTGARYAGFAQMPSAESFGPDGGMGPPQGPDEMLRMLENPMFQGQMNEAMNNPHVIQMMQNSPMIRNNPMLRQMLENPEFRRTMMDPNVIRQSMQMQRMMGGGGQGQQGMPAPGVTDTTPQQQGQNAGGQAAPPNPLLGMGGPQGMGLGGQQGNPFAALFGGNGAAGGMGSPPSTNTTQNPSSTNPTSPTPSTGNNQQQNTAPGTQPIPQQNQQQPPNPFAGMFGGMPQAGQGRQGDGLASMTQQMMQNPEMMRMAMQMMGGMNLDGQPPQQGQNPQGGAQNPGQAGADPFASMFGPGAGGGGANPFGGMFGNAGAQSAPPQQDPRPPEEQFADQLRQLNEMGFFEFERNVRALRMAGGNVSGAIEMLLSGTI